MFTTKIFTDAFDKRHMTEPTEFLPGIYVGDQYTASNADFFRRNNITRVVNCTTTLPFFFKHVEYFRIPVDDSSDDANNNLMAAYLLPAIQFVLKDRLNMEIVPANYVNNTFGRRAGVLIHCHAGISRSCTVAVAVLRYCCFPTLHQAIDFLVSKRKIAFLNGLYFNFRKALVQVFQ